MLTWKVCWSIPAPWDLWGLVASGCGWAPVTKKGVLQSSSWWGMSCVRLRVANTMPRSFHWVTGLHLDCFVWEQTACTKQPAKFPSTLCPFKALLFFFNSFTCSQAGSCSSFEINEAFAISLSPCPPLDWHSSTAQVLCLWRSLASSWKQMPLWLILAGEKDRGQGNLWCPSWQISHELRRF